MNRMKRNQNVWQTVLVILGIAWIVLPDPIVGPIDDYLVAALRVLPLITQAIEKIRSNRYKYGRGNGF